MFKHATIGILIVNSKGKIVSANPFAEKLFGYERGNLEGQSVDMLVPDALRGGHAKHRKHYHQKPVERVMGAGLDLFAKRKDGTTFPVEISLGHTEFEGQKMAFAYINDITARQKASAGLEENKSRLAAIIDTAVDGIITINRKGIVESINPAAAKLFGFGPNEVIGNNIKMLMPEPDKSGHDQYLKNHQTTKTRKIIGIGREVTGLRKDGTTFPFHLSVSEVKFGKSSIYTGILHDLTDRKIAEDKMRRYAQALKKSEQQLKEAQKLAKIGHFEWDIPKDKVYWSDELYRIFGYEPQSFEVTVNFLIENTHPQDQKKIANLVIKVLDEKQAQSFGYRILTQNKEVRHVFSTREVELDRKGNILRLFGTVRDVTEQKRREEELMIKDMAISSSPLPIAFADLDNKITYTNQAFLDLWGYENEAEVLGKPTMEFGQDTNRVKSIMQSVQEKGHWVGEDTAKKKDGTSIDLFVSTSMVKDEKDNPICMLGTFLDLTEQKKVQAYNQDISKIVEDSLNEIYIFGAKDLKFIQVNKGGRQNIGYTQEELKQISPVDIKPEFTHDEFIKTIRPLLDGQEEGLIFFTIHERKNGTTYPVEVHLQYAKLDEQPVFVAFIDDITNQRAYETALEKEKESAQTYLDIAGSMMLVVNKQEQITLLNQRGEEILGVSQKEVLGKNWFDLFVPVTEREEVRQVFYRLMARKGKNVEYFENSIIDNKGKERLIWWQNRVLFDKEGNVQGTISSGVDITELRETEKQLQESQLELKNYAVKLEEKVKERTTDLLESEQKLKQAQSIAKIGHWDLEVATDVLTFSTGMYKIYGLSEGEPISRKLMDTLIHPDDAEELKNVIKQAIDTQKGISVNHRIITPTGQLKFVRSNVQPPVVDETGKVIRVFGVLKDITTLKRSELQLHEALTKEKELGMLKSRFVSMASHEFRTPLSSILSSAELLGMYIESGKLERTGKNLKRIKNSVRNLTGILNDFLSLEKLEAGKLEVQKTKVETREFLQDLSEEIKPLLRPKQQLVYGDNLPKSIEVDPYLLKNVLINLTSNAIKYSPNGKNVTLDIISKGKELVFKVIDQGIGIPKEDHQHMFSRFFRASNVENIKGTGLGLTIVKRYLDLMGGDIGFESEYGKGSTFYFHLPR